MATPTSWTDNNMSWPTSVSAANGRPLMPYLDACRAAAAERFVSDSGVTNWFDSQIGNEMPLVQWAHQWSDEIDALINRRTTDGGWLDPAAESGWAGAAAAPDLVSNPGEWINSQGIKRIYPAAGSPLSWQWIYQQYQIINSLRWVIDNTAALTWTPNDGNESGAGQTTSAYGTYAAAVAYADSVYATSAPYSGTNIAEESAWGKKITTGTPGFGAGLINRGYRYRFGVDDAMNADVDVYMYTEASTITSTPQVNTFHSNGRGFSEGVYNLAETVSKTAAVNYVDSGWFGDAKPSSTAVQPSVDDGYEVRGWKSTAQFAVIKYDIPNGFNFYT